MLTPFSAKKKPKIQQLLQKKRLNNWCPFCDKLNSWNFKKKITKSLKYVRISWYLTPVVVFYREKKINVFLSSTILGLKRNLLFIVFFFLYHDLSACFIFSFDVGLLCRDLTFDSVNTIFNIKKGVNTYKWQGFFVCLNEKENN